MKRKHIWAAATANRSANTPAGRICFSLTVLLLLAAARADTMPDLPGEELTQERFELVTKRAGTVQTARDSGAYVQSPASSSWLDAAMDTWLAPTLAEQMAADETIIPFGKGGIFVPRYAETSSEPDVEVYDPANNHIVSVRTGRAVTLIPGDYDVTLGSGSQQQRIVKRVTVEEGRVTPVIPDWSGLIVEVVDKQGIAFKGEYELARIDEFDPYGRGYGASVELGETVKAWILKPGTYKILGAGESYNTMTNFVTVRLLPGELTNFLLIQDSSDNYSIRGGGTLQLASATRLLASNWHWGANIGANLLFNMEIDHEAEIKGETNSLTMGLLFDTWVIYRKKPVEWNTRLRLDESINITENDQETMINSPDRILLSSIFIWRILNWLGPYARSEFNTKLFNTKLKRNKEDRFCFVDTGYVFSYIDTSLALVTEPAFSPLIFEVGAGVNADLTTRRYFEARARLGFGSTYSRYADRHRIIEADRVKYPDPADSLHRADVEQNLLNSIILFPEEKVSILEVGPQASLGVTVRIGAFASAEAEVKLFAPVAPNPRIDRPDFDFNGTLSWRLSSFLNLDYTYRQTLRQPVELDVPDHKSSHGIWLRLHFSSR